MGCEVSLRELTKRNWLEAVRLSVREDQKGFVASNAFSLAESKFDPSVTPLAIYAGDEMVGFTMYGHDPERDLHWIIRLMVDARYQGRGYGRKGIEEVLRRMRRDPACREIYVSYDPGNGVAERLYLSLGFQKTGLIEDGEVVLRLPVEQRSQ